MLFDGKRVGSAVIDEVPACAIIRGVEALTCTDDPIPFDNGDGLGVVQLVAPECEYLNGILNNA